MEQIRAEMCKQRCSALRAISSQIVPLTVQGLKSQPYAAYDWQCDSKALGDSVLLSICQSTPILSLGRGTGADAGRMIVLSPWMKRHASPGMLVLSAICY